MANQKESAFIEALRYIIGTSLPEIGRVSSKIAQRLPPGVRHPLIAAALAGFAQFVEKQNLRGLQESLSDIIETFARALREEPRVEEPVKKELINIKEKLEEIQKNLSNAKSVGEVEEQREIALAMIKALMEIGRSLVELDEILSPKEERREIKIEWDKILKKLQRATEIIKGTLAKNLPEIYNKIRDEYTRIDQEWAKEIKKARREIKKWPRPF